MAETNENLPPKLSFSNDLWEGIDQLKDMTEAGLENCKDILEFFKKLSTLEDEYAKKMSSVAQRYAPKTETTTLQTGWKAVVASIDRRAELHKNLAGNVTTNICQPTQLFLKDMDTRKKQLVSAGSKLRQEQKESAEGVKRAKGRYDKACKDLEVAKADLQQAKITEVDPQSPKIIKLERRVFALETDAQGMESQYRTQIDASNIVLDDYQTSRWPALLDEFQQFENTRINFLKSNMHNFLGLMHDLPSVLVTEIESGLQKAEKIDADLDIQKYIEANRTKKEFISPFVFEQYQETQPRTPRQSSTSIWDQLKSTIIKEEPPKLPSIFNIPLVDLLEKQKDTYPDLLLPKIIVVLTETIVGLNGLTTEGIFRVAGSPSEIASLRRQLDKGLYNVTNSDPHVLANVLKLYLREIPEPLIPSQFYDDCVANPSAPLEILPKLPKPHRDALTYLINYLQLISLPHHIQHNRMDTVNLGIIFSPVIMRCPHEDANLILANSPVERQFTENLLRQMPPPDPTQFPALSLLFQMSAEQNSAEKEKEKEKEEEVIPEMDVE